MTVLVADVFAPEKRSWLMGRVRNTGTAPELELRRALRRIGLRGWRSQLRTPSGTPDIAFPAERVAVYVDGAFWHGHPSKFRFGKSGAFWDAKVGRNIARDRQERARLRRDGWSVLRVWDFEALRTPERAAERIRRKVLMRSGVRLVGVPASLMTPHARTSRLGRT